MGDGGDDERLDMAMRGLRFLVLALCLAAPAASAETLPLPASLVDFSSPEGEAFLLESGALAAYFPISANFVTQKTQAYCGVASMVMVLNALHAPAPASAEYEPYRTFTQDNILDEGTDAVLPRDVVARQGMTLDQLGALLTLRGAAVEVHHAAGDGLDAFRAAARAALGARDHYVLVNYLRSALGQQAGGHISPLAAYDERTDRFLILDVARYKYPPVWVTTSDLFEAMNTPDVDNENKTRGYVLISRGAGGAVPAQ
jgi:hypothetical protein